MLAYIGVLEGRLTAGSVDGKTGKFLQRVPIANSTVDPAVSLDGKWLAVPATAAGGFYRVDVMDARTGAIRARIPTGSRLISFVFSRDGSALALATSTPATVQVIDLPAAPEPKP